MDELLSFPFLGGRLKRPGHLRQMLSVTNLLLFKSLKLTHFPSTGISLDHVNSIEQIVLIFFNRVSRRKSAWEATDHNFRFGRHRRFESRSTAWPEKQWFFHCYYYYLSGVRVKKTQWKDLSFGWKEEPEEVCSLLDGHGLLWLYYESHFEMSCIDPVLSCKCPPLSLYHVLFTFTCILEFLELILKLRYL